MDNYSVFIKFNQFTGKRTIELTPVPFKGNRQQAPPDMVQLKPIPFDHVTRDDHGFTITHRSNDRAVVYLDGNNRAHLIYGYFHYPISVDPEKRPAASANSFWRAALPVRQTGTSQDFEVALTEPFSEADVIDRERRMVSYYYQIPENSPVADESEYSDYQTVYQNNLAPEKLIQPGAADSGSVVSSARHDLRNRLVFTIDDETSKDLDDAVEIKKLGDGSFLLGVHIADVTAFVRENSQRDKDAAARATSHYLADRVIHMLPECLSSHLCSLSPDEDRLTVSVYMIVSKPPNGPAIQSMTATRSVIRSRKKLSYDRVQRALAQFDASLGAEINDAIHQTDELADILAAADITDSDFGHSQKVYSSDGQQLQYQNQPYLKSRDIIKQFMVAANQEVGRKIADVLAGITDQQAILGAYRVQEPPHPMSLQNYINILKKENFLDAGHHYDRFNAQAESLVQSMGGWETLSKADYNAAVRSHIAHLIREATIDSQTNAKLKLNVLNKLGGKGYYLFRKAGLSGSPDRSYHHQMRMHRYAWFTSPIRRYPDIINHRQLTAVLLKTSCDLSGFDIRQMAEKIHQAKKASQAMVQRLDFQYRFQNPGFLDTRRLHLRVTGFSWINPKEFEMEATDPFGPIKILFIKKPYLKITHNGLECRFEDSGPTIGIGDAITLTFQRAMKNRPPEIGRIVVKSHQVNIATVHAGSRQFQK